MFQETYICPKCNQHSRTKPWCTQSSCDYSNRFLIDDSLVQKSHKRLKIEEETEFKLQLEEIESQLKQSEFDLSNGDYVISEHCRELKRKVQLAKEIQIEEFNKLSEVLIDKIITYEKETIAVNSTLNKQKQSIQLKEINEQITKCQSDLEQNKMRNQGAIQSIQSKIKIQQENIKSLIFNEKILTYNMFGGLNLNSFDEISYDELHETSFSKYILDLSHKKYFDFDKCKDAVKEDLNQPGFFSNGYFVTLIHFKNENSSDLNIFLFDEKMQLKKIKLVENVDSNSTTESCVTSNKIFIRFKSSSNGISYYCALNDSLEITMKIISNKTNSLLAADEEHIYMNSDSEDEAPLMIYNWSLELVKVIGQRTKPKEPFFFESIYDFKTYVFNKKKYFLILEDSLRIMDESTGVVISEVDSYFTKLDVDSDNNIVCIDGNDLLYYDINCNLLKRIHFIDFPGAICTSFASLKWFIHNNKSYFYNYFKFSLLN